MMESKLPDVGTTIFTTMSAMATEFDAINLSQGFPDFSPPAGLLRALKQATDADTHQYPPMIGIAPLRHQIRKKVKDFYSAEVDADTEITVTSGATEALFVAIQALVQQGDEVIVFDPAYDAYDPAIRLAGGKAVHLSLNDKFEIDWNLVEAAINPRTRGIIINSPHNPSGSVLTANDIDCLAELSERHNLIVISDEVYEHMIFDDEIHASVLRHEALRQRAMVVSSFGKTFHATGWKVGYLIASEELSVEFRKIHQFVNFTTHTPSQYAIAQFMRESPEHSIELARFYQQKRDLFSGLLADSNFTLFKSAGTYFQLADYSQISSASDIEFVRYLTQEIGVAAIPMSVFYANPPQQSLIRFCFAKHDDTLRLAASKLNALTEVTL